MGVLIWVVVALFQLFATTGSFLVLDRIVPKQMIIAQSANGAKTLLRSGLDYVAKPHRKA